MTHVGFRAHVKIASRMTKKLILTNANFNPNSVTPFLTLIGNESAPIQLAECRFPGLAISNAKIWIHFSNKINGSNFIKEHPETVMVRNYQSADCSLRKKHSIVVCYFIIFGTLSFPILLTRLNATGNPNFSCTFSFVSLAAVNKHTASNALCLRMSVNSCPERR